MNGVERLHAHINADNARRQPGCRNKIAHRSRAAANKALRRMSRDAADFSGKRRDGRLQAYECPGCGQWHVGHARRS